MSRRSYGQYCGLARALDLVGERWSLLLVRDLAVGPKRFTELQAGLKGIGTSLLSERLRHLEEVGLARRTAAELPAGGLVYELTDEGTLLARALGPLTVWGATTLADQPDDDAEWRPDWLMFTLESSFRPDLAGRVNDCYEFRLGRTTLWAVVAKGRISVITEKPREPDFVATLDLPTLAGLSSGLIDPATAVTEHNAKFEGDPAAARRALRLLGSAGQDSLPS